MFKALHNFILDHAFDVSDTILSFDHWMSLHPLPTHLLNSPGWWSVNGCRCTVSCCMSSFLQPTSSRCFFFLSLICFCGFYIECRHTPYVSGKNVHMNCPEIFSKSFSILFQQSCLHDFTSSANTNTSWNQYLKLTCIQCTSLTLNK